MKKSVVRPERLEQSGDFWRGKVKKSVVRPERLERSHPREYQALNLACLPIPARALVIGQTKKRLKIKLISRITD